MEPLADRVLWHDLECGGYRADLPLWRELAELAGGAVLDVGAGTGRVAVELGRRGTEVIALDMDAELIGALRVRARGLDVDAVIGDAREFELDRRFPLIVVAMQTVQLLGGRLGRARFFDRAQSHLAPGGTLAIAVVDRLEEVDERNGPLPLPDVVERGGWVYVSQPTAVRREDGASVIERRRESIGPDGERLLETDTIRLDDVTVTGLEHEGSAVGLTAIDGRRVPATDDYVPSTVVMFRG